MSSKHVAIIGVALAGFCHIDGTMGRIGAKATSKAQYLSE